MKSRRPRLAAALMALGWVAFLFDRWLLPQGSLLLEVWLTVVGTGYLIVAFMAIRGSRLGTATMPWAAILLMVWGIVALLGLSSDSVSSRSWMWASIYAVILGTATFVVATIPLDRRPSAGLLMFLALVGFMSFAAWLQISRCRVDLHASWCDPRYEQEDRIVATVQADRSARNTGHIGGVLGPAFASYIFAEAPDPHTAVIPRSATAVATDDPNVVEWRFGGRDIECRGQSLVQAAVGGYEVRFTVDCRP